MKSSQSTAQLSQRVHFSRNLSLFGGIIMIIFGISCIVFASSLLITHTRTGYFATILEGSFSIPAIALDYVIGFLLVIAGILALMSSVMLANVKRRYHLSVAWVVFVSLSILMAVLRIGLTIGSLHVNPKINTPQETHDDSVKKYAYIISIVLSTLAIFFCCIPFLTCSAYQVSTLKKLVKIGSIDYEYHLLTKEPGESNAPYTDYNAPNDVPLMQTGVEDD